MNPEPFSDPAALHRYAKAHGLEYAWAYSPAFNKRLRMLAPEQYEIREVRTRRGTTKVLLFSAQIILDEYIADKPRRDRLAAKRLAWRSRMSKLDFGQFAPRAGERVLQGQKIRQGILLLSRLGRDSKEIDAPHILHLQPSLTD